MSIYNIICMHFCVARFVHTCLSTNTYIGTDVQSASNQTIGCLGVLQISYLYVWHAAIPSLSRR